jgi:ribosomal protein S21
MEKDFLILHGSPILALDSAVRKYKWETLKLKKINEFKGRDFFAWENMKKSGRKIISSYKFKTIQIKTTNR